MYTKEQQAFCVSEPMTASFMSLFTEQLIKWTMVYLEFWTREQRSRIAHWKVARGE